jgi:hypothetical protein
MNAQVSILELKELHHLDDGILAQAFAANLAMIIADLTDRPNDDRTRKLAITFSFVPAAQGGDLDRVKLEYKVTHNIAGHEGRECTLTPRKMGKETKLAFANLGTDARQPGFEFDPDREPD